MKNSYIKMIWREFKNSFGRFAAIFGIVALGVGLLSGLLVTTPDMHKSIDKYYDKHNMADIFIKATMGLTKEDLEEVKEIENVKDIMPAYVMDNFMKINNKSGIVARVYGIPLLDSDNKTNINKLELLEGRMPKNSRECLVEREGVYLQDIKIGSKLKISEENEDYDNIDEIYEEKEYKVVGIVGNSFHFSKEREVSNVGSGKLDTIIYIDEDNYALEEFTDFYIVLKDALEMDSFSSEYQKYTDKIRKKLEELGEKRSDNRKDEILDKAHEELEEGYEEYNDAKLKVEKELSNALDEINKGKRELESSFLEIKDSEKEIEDAKKTLEKETKKAEREIIKGEKELEESKLELIKAEKDLETAKLELEKGEKEYNEGYKEYEEGKEELEEAKKGFSKAEEEFLEKEEEIIKGKRELEKGKQELVEAKRELERGQSQYEKGLSELNAGKALFLSSLRPITEDIGYSSSKALISTAQGRSALKAYLIGTNQKITKGLAQARAQKNEIKNAIKTLPQLKTQLEQMEAQLKVLEQNPEDNKEKIAFLKEKISELENGIQKIEAFKPMVEQIDNTIMDLEKKLNQLPSYDYLISNWNEIQKNEEELDQAKESLDEGKREYEEGLKEIREAEKELNQGQKQIEQGREELNKNRKKLEMATRQSKKGLEELQQAKGELEEGKKEYQLGLQEFKEGLKEYEKGEKELKDARIALEEETESAIKEIESGEKEIEEGLKEYNKGLEEIQRAENDYKEAKIEAEKELSDAYDELLEAEAEIEDLEDPEWYVLDRDSNVAYVSFDLNAEKVEAVSRVFPIFFYLVAGLVALTTMTRMVEEERTQIGVLKALGYKKSTIIFKYILYCGLASVLGSIAGQLVGFRVIPLVIWNTYGTMYHLPEFIIDYNTKIAILSSGMAILSTVGATYFSANQALKEKPSLLMLPKPPKKGKRILLERITPLWSLMSFNLKSTARNIFRYKKHFYMTVIGISGCTALLIAGFGLRDSIKDVATLQFSEIFQYELQIKLEEDVSSESLDEITRENDVIADTLKVFSDEGYIEFKDESIETTLVGIENIKDMDEYVLFRDRKSGTIIEPSKDKIIVSEKIAEELNIKTGDTVIYENSDEIKKEFKIDGITENYIGNYIYMDKSIYERTFKGKNETNTIYAKTEKIDSNEEDKIIKDLYENEDILNAEFISQSRGTIDNLLESINYIVIVIIIASGLLAFIVLYNLTNININERRRELASLKVLGFHNEEIYSYIFREITILALIGTFVGLVLGKYLHRFIILTVEDPGFMFGRNVAIISYVLSAIITMIFSVIVDLFMVKKLKNIKMVDSLKAND